MFTEAVISATTNIFVVAAIIRVSCKIMSNIVIVKFAPQGSQYEAGSAGGAEASL